MSREARPQSARRASLAAALAACCLAPALEAGAHEPAARGPVRSEQVAGAASAARLQVTQVDYRLLLSHATVRAGTVDLAELDRGRNPHDLRLRLETGGPTIAGKLLTPGRRWDGVVHLLPGAYRLWCSLPEHATLGMHTVLRVTR